MCIVEWYSPLEILPGKVALIEYFYRRYILAKPPPQEEFLRNLLADYWQVPRLEEAQLEDL